MTKVTGETKIFEDENIGARLIDSGRDREAFPYVQAAAHRTPCARTYGNLGICLYHLGAHAEAEIAFRKVVEIEPDHAVMQYNLAFTLLAQGKYLEGWRQIAWRKRLPKWSTEGEPFKDVPTWDGQPLPDKTIALYHEQGFGDALMLVRYVTQVQHLVERVCLITPPETARLFKLAFDLDTYRPVNAPKIDYQCSLFDLPALCGATLDNIARKPYLHADRDDMLEWATKLATLPPGPRVGLVWAGGKRPRHLLSDARRSLSLTQLAPILDVTGVNFVSLQKNSVEPNALSDWTDDLIDFADTAALIANLDLVISVDTSVAHLAAAMGHPVWLLNRYDCCWRWLPDRRMAWYGANVREFRQPSLGDWVPVIQAVRTALVELST